MPKRAWLMVCVYKKNSTVFTGISFTCMKLFITPMHLSMLKIAAFQIQVDWKSIKTAADPGGHDLVAMVRAHLEGSSCHMLPPWKDIPKIWRPWLSCHCQCVSWGIILPYVAYLKGGQGSRATTEFICDFGLLRFVMKAWVHTAKISMSRPHKSLHSGETSRRSLLTQLF